MASGFNPWLTCCGQHQILPPRLCRLPGGNQPALNLSILSAPQVTIARSVNPKNKDRLVNITVRNIGVDLLIVQPFVRPQNRWQKGTYADALDV